MKNVIANRTGVDASPLAAEMLELTQITKPSNLAPMTLGQLDAQALALAGPTGSLPPAPDSERRFLLDQMSARLAFERTGVRLYDAVLRKAAAHKAFPDGPTVEELEHFREEEAEHFALLRRAIIDLGGDPTLVSPCANLEATCSTGVLQAVTDPRTDLGETLSAVLITELTDNDAWSSLIDLAQAAGQDELASSFREAESHEADHLAHVRAWVSAYRSWRLDGHGDRGGQAGVMATVATKARKAKATAGTKRRAKARR